MQLTATDYEEIERLASESYTAKAIAIGLDVNPSLFALLCSDDNHPIGKAFQKGLLEIERKKNEVLIDKLDTSETAIQIHDKKAKAQAFKDIKEDIFSDDTNFFLDDIYE